MYYVYFYSNYSCGLSTIEYSCESVFVCFMCLCMCLRACVPACVCACVCVGVCGYVCTHACLPMWCVYQVLLLWLKHAKKLILAKFIYIVMLE